MATWPQASQAQDGDLGRSQGAGTNATCPSPLTPAGNQEAALASGCWSLIGGRLRLGPANHHCPSLRNSERWSTLSNTRAPGKPAPGGYTDIHPDWGLPCRRRGAAATALRPLDLTPLPPREPPRQGQAGSLPPRWLDTLLDRHGREKAGNSLCLPGTRQPLPSPQAALVGPPRPCSAAPPGPQGTDSNLGGPRTQLSAGRGRSWSLSDSGWLWARSGLGLAGGSGC